MHGTAPGQGDGTRRRGQREGEALKERCVRMGEDGRVSRGCVAEK